MQELNHKTICFVIPRYVTFNTGGAEIQVYYLVKAFLKQGWQVELICGGKGFEDRIAQSPFQDSRVKVFNYRFRKIRSLEFFEVLRLLLKTKARVYYQRTDFALSGACALYCRITGKPMVYALAQDKDAVKGKYRTELKSFSYRSKIKKAVRLVDFMLIDKLVEYAKQNANILICQNQLQKQLLKANFNRNSHLIPSSYPMDEVPHKVKKENLVLWVGNMRKEKQPELFIELVNKLKNKDGWRFVMIGKVSDSYQYLKHDNVEVLGEQSYDDVNNWFAKARFFVNTSNTEGMPNTFIQSWIYQVLVLSLSVNPNGVFDDDTYGLSFNGSIDAMAKHLDQLLTGQQHDEVLDRARKYAIDQYDVVTNANKLMKLLNR